MQHDPSVSLLAEGGGKIVAMSGGGVLRGGAPAVAPGTSIPVSVASVATVAAAPSAASAAPSAPSAASAAPSATPTVAAVAAVPPAITITGVAGDALKDLRTLLIGQNATASPSASASTPLATVSDADLTDSSKTDSIKMAFLANVKEYIRQDTSKFSINLLK